MNQSHTTQDTAPREIKDLKEYAQQVWMLPILADKRLVALEMVNNFEFKAKANHFITLINKSSATKLDILVGDIILAGEGLSVKK